MLSFVSFLFLPHPLSSKIYQKHNLTRNMIFIDCFLYCLSLRSWTTNHLFLHHCPSPISSYLFLSFLLFLLTYLIFLLIYFIFTNLFCFFSLTYFIFTNLFCFFIVVPMTAWFTGFGAHYGASIGKRKRYFFSLLRALARLENWIFRRNREMFL